MNLIPAISTKRIAIKLKPAAERMAKKSHPWVFEDSIIKQNQEGEPGDLAIIFDSKTNKFLACGLYDPDSPIRLKLIQFHESKKIDAEWFKDKIDNAKKLRKSLLKTDTNSYRFISGENDGFPGLIADVYDHVLVIKLYTHIWFPYFNEIAELLIAKSGCNTAVLRLSRNAQKTSRKLGVKDGQVIHGTLENENVQFKEHGVWFTANVIKGHKTGFFLDHRANRKKVGELAAGNRVLDVFSYAGGFSVHALVGGAKSVLSLDISKQALELAKANAQLNEHSGTHEVVEGDAFESLQKFIDEKRNFDLIVIDPPSFAKSKPEIPRAIIAYKRLAQLGVKCTAKNGILILASCSSRILADEFYSICEKELSATGRHYEAIMKSEHDKDHPVNFPEGAYLKCAYYQFFD
ncbi:MAG: 23S rRNA (cytosine1962-C5)-methyltransferase [Parvicellaceae bacterium]